MTNQVFIQKTLNWLKTLKSANHVAATQHGYLIDTKFNSSIYETIVFNCILIFEKYYFSVSDN